MPCWPALRSQDLEVPGNTGRVCHLHDPSGVPTEIEEFLDFCETRRNRILEKLRHLLGSDSTENLDQHGESPEG